MMVFMLFFYLLGYYEFVEFGFLGIVMLCYFGCWVGFKVLFEIVEILGIVDLFREYWDIIILIDFEMLLDGLNFWWLDKLRD